MDQAVIRTKREFIEEIRRSLAELRLARERISDDNMFHNAFHHAYERLLERFYQECIGMVTYQQYAEAKKDFDYLEQLVEQVAIYLHDEETENEHLNKSLH